MYYSLHFCNYIWFTIYIFTRNKSIIHLKESIQNILFVYCLGNDFYSVFIHNNSCKEE